MVAALSGSAVAAQSFKKQHLLATCRSAIGQGCPDYGTMAQAALWKGQVLGPPDELGLHTAIQPSNKLPWPSCSCCLVQAKVPASDHFAVASSTDKDEELALTTSTFRHTPAACSSF